MISRKLVVKHATRNSLTILFLYITFSSAITTVFPSLTSVTCTSTGNDSLQPVITIQPSDTLTVGEEVFFSGTKTAYPNYQLLRRARFEWDFGDGTSFKFKSPDETACFSGLGVVHFFMKPGTFTVTLTVSIFKNFNDEGDPIEAPHAVARTTKTIHVKGEKSIPGFEILHAPFHNRTAQYLYVQTPNKYQTKETTLNVTIEGPNNFKQILLTKTKPASEEQLVLHHVPLSKGSYLLKAELLDAKGKRIPEGLWQEKFTKPYNGLPMVGINENNSFLRNGKLFFPLGPFMTDLPSIPKFVTGASINMLHTEGWYETHSPTTWADYALQAAMNNCVTIGPGRGDYDIPDNKLPYTWRFNMDFDRFVAYIKTTKDRQNMFAWSYCDEPDLGGRSQKVYPPTLAAWAYATHQEDPHHPTFNLYYGYDYSRYYGTGPRVYDYLGSAVLFGGKKWIQDAIPFDVYPYTAWKKHHPSLDLAEMGPHACYLDLLDRIHTSNKYLVPVLPCIQPCQENENDYIPTPDQVFELSWSNVIHNAKGIIWFPLFNQSTITWSALKKFGDQMKELDTIILGPQPSISVTDNANQPNNRVDAMIRQTTNGTIYLFTVRVTEPDPIPDCRYKSKEPPIIGVTFNLKGNITAQKIEVLYENRSLVLSNSSFTDTFPKSAVHIYRISP